MAKIDPITGLVYEWGTGFDGWGAQMDDNLRFLSRVSTHLSVIDKDVTDPSALTPADGDRYIVGPSAIGAWASYDGYIAVWDDDYATWVFYQPRLGWFCYIEDENVVRVFEPTGWEIQSTNSVIEKFEDVVTPAIAAGVLTLDYSLGQFFAVTLDQNITSIVINNVPGGGSYPLDIEFTQDATGGYTVAGWPASVKWPGGTAPTVSPAANAVDVITGYSRDAGVTWRLGLAMQDSK